MPDKAYLYVEAVTGVATMVAVGFVSGLAAGAVIVDRAAGLILAVAH